MRWTNKHTLAASRSPPGNKVPVVVLTMPRENAWHHRKGARSESHEIKGEVFRVRVLSMWKETRPHQKLRPTPRDIKQSIGAELEEKR